MVQDWVATWPTFVKIVVIVYLAFIAIALQAFLIRVRNWKNVETKESWLVTKIRKMRFLPYMFLQIIITAISVLAALAFAKAGGEDGKTVAELVAMLISYWPLVVFMDEKLHVFGIIF